MSAASRPPSPAAGHPIGELAELGTPASTPGFWDELHALLVAAADEREGATDAHRAAAAVTAVVPHRTRRRAGRARMVVPVAAAAAALVAVLVAVAALGRPGASDPGPADSPGTVVGTGSAPVASDPTAAPAAPDATVSTVSIGPITGSDPTAPAPGTVTPAPLARTLTVGTSGDDVRMVQQRLADLTFDPGPVDGSYSQYTEQAVWAFEALVLGRPLGELTGVVTPETWTAMQGDVVVVPRRTDLTSTHVEIYLPEQALVVFQDDRPALIAHISSGELAPPGDDFTVGQAWCREVTISPGEIGNEAGDEPIVDGRCGNSVTPGGTYRAYRRVEGRRDSARGAMSDPVYFNYGIAVYGAEQVPSGPSSEGGVRLNRRLAPIFAELVSRLGRNTGDQIYVWNGVMEPEAYGAKPGRFDWAWPRWRDAHAAAGG